MPELCRFYGIIIRMYFQQAEHNPPHIHVIYGDDIAEIELNTFEILEGRLPKNAQKLVTEWMGIHKDELLEIWETQRFKKIEPLD